MFQGWYSLKPTRGPNLRREKNRKGNNTRIYFSIASRLRLNGVALRRAKKCLQGDF